MSFIRHRRPSCRNWKFEVDIVWRCNVFFSAFCMFYWAFFKINLFNLTNFFIKWFFHSILMQYFRLIRGIHISTRNLIFLYQGVVKSSLIAKNYVFRTPPLTILFFRRIRPRHCLTLQRIFSVFCMFYWVIFKIRLFNLMKIFIKWFFTPFLCYISG